MRSESSNLITKHIINAWTQDHYGFSFYFEERTINGKVHDLIVCDIFI